MTSSPEKLTARQAEILALIRSSVETEGAPPTRAEIARHFGFRSANAAEEHLRALARKGFIAMEEGRARGIRLLERLGGLPLVGRVAAGSPILAQEHVETRYQIDPDLFQPRAHYLLKVRGMSMRDAGILEGDLLAVHQTSTARQGQIVIARVGDEVTVKRLQQDGPLVTLLPANPDFAPLQVDTRREPLHIEGIAVGLIRNGTLV